MAKKKEIRVIQVALPAGKAGRRTEIRVATITVLFSDETWTTTKVASSMKHWASSDLLEDVKKIISQLEK